MKRHEIRVLKKAGLTNDEVSAISGVPVRSVQRVAHEPAAEAEAARLSRPVGRPSKAEPFRKDIEAILKDEPALPTVEVLHRLQGLGYEGGKSAVYALVAELRCAEPPAMVRFDGLPGEFAQNDFGHVDVVYADRTKERLHFFISRLKFSRWIEVRLVKNESVESLVRALLSCFETFQGVPLVCVFDNPKTVVLRRSGTKIDWNRTFGQVALDYRFAPELCTPGRGQEKGSVENAVGFVKGSFFKVRRFHDREDLLSQLRAWHVEVNEKRSCRATGVPPIERMVKERERLRPLAIPAAEYALHFPVMVGPTGRVEHNRISYSMPAESIGIAGTLYLYEDRVRILAGRYEAEHPRQPTGGRSSFLPEHRSSLLARVSGARAKLYFKRQQLLELGDDAEALLTEIVHRHPRTWRGEVEILFDLLQRFGEPRMLEALHQAVHRRLFGARYVADLLKRSAG